MIAIIDYGMGNFAAIKNMLDKLGHEAIIASDPKMLHNAKKIILPGVGSFDSGINKLRSSGFFDEIKIMVAEYKTPILGVCLGMQLLFEKSEEGKEQGLSLLEGDVVKFSFKSNQFKIPHMGWQNLEIINNNYLLKSSYSHQRFYFVHSYYVNPTDKSCISAFADYGIIFPASIEKNNIFGVQFHPEKSHKFGLELLNKFANMQVT